jgi:hypothetical protein
MPLAAVAATEGCAILTPLLNNPIFLAGISVAVDVGVGIALKAAGANAPADAAAIVSACTQLEAIAQGSTVTVANLVAALEAKISASITNPDVVLALNTVVQFVGSFIEGIVATIPAGASADMVTFFQDVSTAAQAYVTVASTASGKALLKLK